MPAEPRYRRIGQTNSQMTNDEREASIDAIKASARDKRLGHLRRQDDHKQAMEKNESVVSEYLESYFGGELNESTSDEDIMGALYDLLETADAVEEFLEEGTDPAGRGRPSRVLQRLSFNRIHNINTNPDVEDRENTNVVIANHILKLKNKYFDGTDGHEDADNHIKHGENMADVALSAGVHNSIKKGSFKRIRQIFGTAPQSSGNPRSSR